MGQQQQPDGEFDYRCPRCGKGFMDFDGFGFIACFAVVDGGCGYCTHPERLGGACTICGDEEASA